MNSHVSHIYAKLGVGTRTEAMHVAFQRGLVDVATTPPSPLRIRKITDRVASKRQ